MHLKIKNCTTALASNAITKKLTGQDENENTANQFITGFKNNLRE